MYIHLMYIYIYVCIYIYEVYVFHIERLDRGAPHLGDAIVLQLAAHVHQPVREQLVDPVHILVPPLATPILRLTRPKV